MTKKLTIDEATQALQECINLLKDSGYTLDFRLSVRQINRPKND